MTIAKLFLNAVLSLASMIIEPVGIDPIAHMSKVNTPISQDDLYHVLETTHVEVMGFKASKNRLTMAESQVELENGMGKETYNYNLGNIGAGSRQNYYRVGPAKYRSFKDHHSAALTYWKVLSKCQVALKNFDAGRASGAAISLRKCGYFRADVDEYSRALGSLFYSHN